MMRYLRFGFVFAVALAAALTGVRPAAAQDAAQPYPKMAPIEQYLMERDAEIALARSGAPDAISKHASVYVLTRRGYEMAAKGSNGWACWVGRSWVAIFDNPEFWNPKIRAAECINAPGVRSVLPYHLKRTKLILAGKSIAEVIAALKAAMDQKELPALEPGTVSFMMSKGSYLTDQHDFNMPHLMFYSTADAAAWGANVANSPVLAGSFWYLSPDTYPELKSFPPINIFLVRAGKWSDGTPGPTM